MVEITKKNYLSKSQQRKLATMMKESARTGVRGAFEFLWHFNKGNELVEKIEFHPNWVEMYRYVRCAN